MVACAVCGSCIYWRNKVETACLIIWYLNRAVFNQPLWWVRLRFWLSLQTLQREKESDEFWYRYILFVSDVAFDGDIEQNGPEKQFLIIIIIIIINR